MSGEVLAVIGGTTYKTLLGGFLGSIVSLRFVQNLTRSKAIATVATSLIVANYFTPTVIKWHTSFANNEGGVGFVLGLLAINIISMLFFVTNDPKKFIEIIIGKRK